jgi:HEAT repeat protein
MGALTALDLYAIPELEKIIQKSSNPREVGLAREARQMILEPKTTFELFQPYPYALPSFIEDIGNPGKLKESNVSSPQVKFPGLISRPESSVADPPVPETTPQVKFPGLLNATEQTGETVTYIQLMEQALVRLRSQNSEEKEQALRDLTFYASQFREATSSSNSEVPFISSEKTRLATKIAERLNQSTDTVQKMALLTVLFNLQDPAILQEMMRFLQNESNSSLREQALGILGDLGQPEPILVIRNILNSTNASNELREAALRALLRLNDQESLIQVASSASSPTSLRQLAIQGMGSLRMDSSQSRQILLDTLSSSPPGSLIKISAINALGQILNSNDSEAILQLVSSGLNEQSPVKLALIDALEFLDFIPAVQTFMEQFRQDSDYNVSRAATQFLIRRRQDSST